MDDDIKITPLLAEQNIKMLNQHASSLQTVLNQINSLVQGGLDHWKGEAKDTFVTTYVEVKPKLQACVDFTQDQARVIKEVKQAFEGIKLKKG